MPLERKRRVKPEMTLDKNGQRRGRRKGDGVKVGRKPKNGVAGAPHKARPQLNASYPVHVVLRLHPEVASLEMRPMYRALREATITLAHRELQPVEAGWFRIVHMSLQSMEVHLIVEASHKKALSRGMQAFQISAAKHVNRAYSAHAQLAERRRGSVFPDRFHQEIITDAREARRTLAPIRKASAADELELSLWEPKTTLGRFAVGFVESRPRKRGADASA